MIGFTIKKANEFIEKLKILSAYASVRGGTQYVFICQASEGILFAMSDLDTKYASFCLDITSEINDVRSTSVTYQALMVAAENAVNNCFQFTAEIKAVPEKLYKFESDKNTMLQNATFNMPAAFADRVIDDMRSPVFSLETADKPYASYANFDINRGNIVYTNGRIIVCNKIKDMFVKSHNTLEDIYVPIDMLVHARKAMNAENNVSISKSKAYSEGNNCTRYMVTIELNDMVFVNETFFNTYPRYQDILDKESKTNATLTLPLPQFVKMVDMLPADPDVDENRPFWKSSHAINVNFILKRIYTESDSAAVTCKFFNVAPMMSEASYDVPIAKNYIKFLFGRAVSAEKVTIKFTGTKELIVSHFENTCVAVMPIDRNRYYALKPEEAPF